MPRGRKLMKKIYLNTVDKNALKLIFYKVATENPNDLGFIRQRKCFHSQKIHTQYKYPTLNLIYMITKN